MTDSNDHPLVSYYRRIQRRSLLVIVIAVAAALLLTFLQFVLAPPQLAVEKMGVHLLLDDGRTVWDESLWPDHLDAAAQTGLWVTQLVRLDDLDVARWQRFMDLSAERGLLPIIRLATTWDDATGTWTVPPQDADGSYATVAAQYAEFLAALNWPDAGRRVVIVGNEPNHGQEWGGVPDPAAYARFLVDVTAAIDRETRGIAVLNAPLDFYAPNTNGQPFENGMVYLDAESFLDQMSAAQPRWFDVIDGWATHPYAMGAPWEASYQVDYLNGASNPDAVPTPEGLHNRGVNSYAFELYKLSLLGMRRRLPVFITETGWRQDQIGEAQAALYYDLALRGNNGRYPDLPDTGWTPWLRDERVAAVTPFALAGNPAEWDTFNWLEVSPTGEIGAPRPIFTLAAGLYAQR